MNSIFLQKTHWQLNIFIFLFVNLILACSQVPKSESSLVNPNRVEIPVSHDSNFSLDQLLFRLQLNSIREKLKFGTDKLTPREKYAAGEVLMMTSSPGNNVLGLELLNSTRPETVPCIDYFKAEAFFRGGDYQKALESIESFGKSSVIACSKEKPDLYSCCPQSKYRNAAGLKKTIQNAIAQNPHADFVLNLNLVGLESLKVKAPIVSWKNMQFLIDTGSEQNIWNLACEKELKLATDSAITYGGADSLGQVVKVVYSKVGINLFDSNSSRWSGFAFEFKDFVTSYEIPQSKSKKSNQKMCGIISPQTLVPSGMVVFDWAAKKLLLCQGLSCRKKLDIPVNCPMPMFKGRPYVEASVNGEQPRMMLLDTGANSTSANRNYFSRPLNTETVNSIVTSATAKVASQSVFSKGVVAICGAQFSIRPMAIHSEDKSWEWAENGKIGMDIAADSILALDFGRRMLLFR